MKTRIWITDCTAYGKTKLTCVETDRSLQQIYNDVYFFLWEAASLRSEADDRGDYHYDETEPHTPTTCHLLIKYFGYQLCDWYQGIPELDQSWLWEVPQHYITEYRPHNKRWRAHWGKWLYLTRFRWGLLREIYDLFKHGSEEYRDPKYPWSRGYQSATWWHSGTYIYKVPFGFFWDKASAWEFGQNVLGVSPTQDAPTLGRIDYCDVEGDPTWGSFHLNKIKLYHPPTNTSQSLSDLIEVSRVEPVELPFSLTELYLASAEEIQR